MCPAVEVVVAEREEECRAEVVPRLLVIRPPTQR